jgi:hypothetical protein
MKISTLELREKCNLDGTVWYNIYLDDRCEQTFLNLADAEEFFKKAKKNLEGGLVGEIVLEKVKLKINA